MFIRKSLGSLAVVLFALAYASAAEPVANIQWQTDLLKAYQTARDQGKPLVVLYETNYCEECRGPCQACLRLQREVLSTREFNAFAGRAVFVRVNWFANNDNVQKMKQSLKPEQWPALFVLEARPEVINEQTRIVGVKPLATYVQTLNRYLPAAPATPPAPPAPPAPLAPTAFLHGLWTRSAQLDNGGRLEVRLMFRADGTFQLDMETNGNPSRFTGRYTYANGLITLHSANEIVTLRVLQATQDRLVAEGDGKRIEMVRRRS